MSNLPANIANQALDAIGWNSSIGDLEEGTFEARVILRAYGQCLRQLLRAAHWAFARKQTPLVLLADATGQTPNVGVNVPPPWNFSYAYPNDCMKARFVPVASHAVSAGTPYGNALPRALMAIPPTSQAFGSDFNSDFGPLPVAGQPYQPPLTGPLVTGLGSPARGSALRPARWLEGVDYSDPAPAGVQDWTQQGVSPQGRTAIFTNVPHAHLVYTALMNYPANWDALFRAAFVAYLASEIALPVWSNKDRKFGAAIRAQQTAAAKEKILAARAVDGNEGWYSSDFETDWMKFRRTGSYGGDRGPGAGGPGYLYAGCDDCCGAGSTSAY